MKAINLIRPLFTLLAVVIFSCSSGGDSGGNGDGNGNGNGNSQITSITVQSSATDILVGESITFTVMGNDGTNVTSSATLKVNNITIPSSTYTAYEDGTLSITASYNGLTSPAVQVTVAYDVLTSITLSTNASTYYVGDTIEFSVVGDNTQDLSSMAEISVNGSPIAGDSYTVNSEGTLDVVATYDSFTSNSLEINVIPAPLRYNRNVLIEDYTGTWCGWCPRVSYGIELVEQQTNQAVIVAIHRGSTSSSSGTYDPYNYPAGALENLINLGGYPTAMLNRMTEWNYPEPSNVDQAVNLTGDDADIGIAMSPSLSGNTMNIDVNVKFGEDYSSQNLKLVVYVLEDRLYFNQANYTSYYNGQDPIPNFEHNHVLRGVLTNILGDAIPNSETNIEDVYTTSFSADVSSFDIENSSNINVVAFVVGSDNATINSRSANFGENQNFEVN